MAMGLRGGMGLPKAEGTRGRVLAKEPVADSKDTPKKKKLTNAAWQEAKALIWARRGRLGLGLALMLVRNQFR